MMKDEIFMSTSRYSKSGNQVFHGDLIIVRRGRPLPNRGRFFKKHPTTDTLLHSDEDWQDQVSTNNPLKWSWHNNPPGFESWKAIQKNNPS